MIIYRFMNKNDCFLNDLNPFSRNIDLFMVLIYEFVDKKQFLQNNLKKHALPRNVDTYGYMDKKRFFQNDLRKRRFRFLVPEILIFTDLWTKKDFSKLSQKTSLAMIIYGFIDKNDFSK